jgi:hypothetical protein
MHADLRKNHDVAHVVKLDFLLLKRVGGLLIVSCYLNKKTKVEI